MSARVEKPIAIGKSELVVTDFDVEKLKAPFILRCGALMIDYILIMLAPVICILVGRWMGYYGAKLLNSQINSLGWLIAFLIGITNLVFIPAISGQSLGKFLTGLRIVKIDGKPLTFFSSLWRNIVGYLLTGLTGGLGFLLSLFNSKSRALHDILAGTVVIYGQRRPAAIAKKEET